MRHPINEWLLLGQRDGRISPQMAVDVADRLMERDAIIAAQVDALRKLTIELNDEYIETVRAEWGNTNAAVLRHWRDNAKAVLAKAQEPSR